MIRICGPMNLPFSTSAIEIHRFLPEKPCQTESLAKRLLLILIDVGLLAIRVIPPPPPFLLHEDSSDACVSIHAVASAAQPALF
jgi:hypothetical protein